MARPVSADGEQKWRCDFSGDGLERELKFFNELEGGMVKGAKTVAYGAVAAVVADDILPRGLSNPRWLGRCASVLDDLGQARDMRLAGNTEA